MTFNTNIELILYNDDKGQKNRISQLTATPHNKKQPETGRVRCREGVYALKERYLCSQGSKVIFDGARGHTKMQILNGDLAKKQQNISTIKLVD